MKNETKKTFAGYLAIPANGIPGTVFLLRLLNSATDDPYSVHEKMILELHNRVSGLKTWIRDKIKMLEDEASLYEPGEDTAIGMQIEILLELLKEIEP